MKRITTEKATAWAEEWRKDVSPLVAAGRIPETKEILKKLAHKDRRPSGILPRDVCEDLGKIIDYYYRNNSTAEV
jgi:hypothetical protein